jgi:predicted alpha/beta hydrolase family esterase
VSYPDLPEPFEPQPEDWLAALRKELDAMEGERIVLCHSLACLLWMLNARDSDKPQAERALLVAPPCLDVPVVQRFRADGVSSADLDRAAPDTLVVYSEPDPYCPPSPPKAFPGVFPRLELVEGGGHLNADAGYGPWPAVEEWSLGLRAQLSP